MGRCNKSPLFSYVYQALLLIGTNRPTYPPGEKEEEVGREEERRKEGGGRREKNGRGGRRLLGEPNKTIDGSAGFNQTTR